MKTATKKTATTAADIFTKGDKAENLSIITKALEEAHEIIRKETGAPRATILVTRKTGNTMGHFTNWQPWISGAESFHEIMISANYFPRGARAVLGTLLHETAHSLDLKNGIQGVTGEGYHNKKFKQTAEGLGLTITQAPRIGFSQTEVSDDCATRWADALRLFEEALRLTADSEQAPAPKGRNKNLLKAECGCGNTIRLSAKTLQMCAPSCNNCEEYFVVDGEGAGVKP
jgi:hypothetical protein